MIPALQRLGVWALHTREGAVTVLVFTVTAAVIARALW